MGKVPIRNSAVPTRIFTADSNASSDGKGAIERKEELLTNIAGVVTQLLAKRQPGGIAYGGRGQITDVQQPRYGQQALDVMLPF